MKSNSQHLFLAVIVIALCLLCLSCSKSEPFSSEATGKLELQFSLTVVENDVSNNLKSTSIENYQVAIFISTESEAYMTFDNSSEIPDTLELPVGEYYATASSGENPAAAFDSPYYFGQSENFVITVGETSQVQITCALANIMVTVVYSDQVKEFYTSCSTTVGNAGGSLIFTEDEERPAYFDAGPLSIVAVLNYLDGYGTTQSKSFSGMITDPENGKHYEIQVDADSPEGGGSVSIELNDTVEKVIVTLAENGNNPGNEDGISFGDLLITEIMYDPDSIPDSDGEWIEIYNNSQDTINLKDLVLRRGSTNAFHQIATDLILEPEAYAVLENDSIATEIEGYEYSSIALKNTGEEIFINTYGTDGTNGTVICSVDYGASGFSNTPGGVSMQLDPTVKSATDAQLGSNWCHATEAYSTGDLGTPGQVNTACN